MSLGKSFFFLELVITPHNAKDLHRHHTDGDCKKYDVFTLGGTLTTDIQADEN